MAKRKPPGMGWESFVDRQIREAMERGEFDNLRGSGKPIEGLSDAYDKDWWLKDYMKRESLSILPDTLALQKHVENECERIRALRYESVVRRELEQLNALIRERLKKAVTGPSSKVTEIDIEDFVEGWRKRTN